MLETYFELIEINNKTPGPPTVFLVAKDTVRMSSCESDFKPSWLAKKIMYMKFSNSCLSYIIYNQVTQRNLCQLPATC